MARSSSFLHNAAEERKKRSENYQPQQGQSYQSSNNSNSTKSQKVSGFLSNAAKEREQRSSNYGRKAPAYRTSNRSTTTQQQSTQNRDLRNRYQKERQDAIYATNKLRSGAVDDLVSWSKSVRDAGPKNTHQLLQRSNELQSFFEENSDAYDNKTKAMVQNILQQGRNTLKNIDPSLGMNGAEYANYVGNLQKSMSRNKATAESVRDITEAQRAGDTKTVKAYEQYNDASDRLDALRQWNKELKRQNKLREYESSRQASDFDTLSKYQTTANGKERSFGAFGNQSQNGFNDITYDLVNKNQEAIKNRFNTVYGASDVESRLGTDDADLQRMHDDEIKTFNYLYSQDPNKAYDYLETLRPDLRARQAQYETEQWAKKTEDNFLGASIASVPLKYVGSLDALAGIAIDDLAGKELDTTAGYLRNQRIANAIRGTGGKMAGEWLANLTGDAAAAYYDMPEVKQAVKDKYGSVAEKLGETTYGSVMSALDQLWNLGISGGMQGAALVLMASSAVPDAVVSAKERGLNDREAISLGIIAGAAEYVTEKVSLEALFDMEKIAREGFIKYVATAGFTEGSEEVASDFINFVAEQLIARGKSEFNMAVKNYERQGMSHAEATMAAFGDQVEQSAYSFIGGALAGGGMAVGVGGANQMYQNSMNRAGADIKAQNPNNAMIQRMGDAEVAQLAYDQQQAAEMERVGALAVQQAADQIEAGEDVDPAITEYLMSNANALGVLEEQTGSQEIRTEEDLNNALREYVDNRGEIENWEARRMLDDEGNVVSVAPDYISSRQDLSAAVTNDTIQRSFGEEGQKIYNDVASRAVKNGMTPVEAYQEISQIYNAGNNRQNIGRTNLPAADVSAVFKAGYQDALKYDKNYEAKASFASAKGDTGVVMDGLVNSLMSDKRMAKQIDTMNYFAKALGIRATYVEHLEGGANGVYKPKTKEIFIAADAEEGATIAWVFGHEMTHRLQQVAPAEYNTLKQSVQNALGARFNLEVQRELNKALHAGDTTFTQQMAQDEAVANYVGELVRDRNALDKFIQNNLETKEGKSLLQKIRDFFRKLLDKIGIETESLTPIQRTIEALTKALETGEKNVKSFDEKTYKGLNEDFAKNRYSIAPPYTNGQKAKLAEWVNGMSEEARSYYEAFSAVHDLGMSNLFDGKDITTKFMLASEWNNKISSDKKFKSFAKQLASALPKEMRSSWLDDSGKIIETPFEREFKMQRSFMQRIVDGLPDTVTGTTAVIDGKEIRLADGEKMEGIGGDAYREALYQERVRLFEEGKLPKRKVAGLSKDNWGTLGFLATNQKTGASGDFTTFCPQMYYNKGCFYCYRRAALTSGVNNKLVGQNVWYTGEILQLTDDDVEWLNKKGGLRIQSFGDWMEKYSKQLAEMLSDAEKVGLQIKIITKEPSMIDTVARLKDQGLGKSLYFNLSSDYSIERAGSASEYKEGGAMPLNSMRPYMRDAKGDMWWKRALTVEEANEYRKKYPWVNTRIVATTLDEFIRGLKSDMVDVVTGYHGNIREYERISSETGETLVQMEALGDAGMPRFNFDAKTGKWTIEYSGKTKTHKALAQRIQEEGLEYEYYIKSCCITGRCAECKGKCGQLAKDFNIKNATNRDNESVAYWQTHMQSAEDNDLLFSRREDGMVREGNKAVMTTDRIDYLIEDSAAGSRTDYARWWITSIDPGRFIDLTTRIPMLERDRFDQVDYDYMEGLKKERQTPFLLVEYPSGQIVGHEGRHRMRALEKAGIKSSEISIGFYDEDGHWLKEMNGYGNPLETIDSLQIENQFETGDSTRIENIIPMNNSTRDEVLASYGEGHAQEGDIKYSRRDSEGRELSEGQAEYFKDSKARDDEGRLLQLYHGTSQAGFTVFNPGLVWLTTSRRDADSYGGNDYASKTFDPNEDRSYEAKLSTIEDLVKHPRDYKMADIRRAMDAYDENNAYSDMLAEGYTKTDIIESLKELIKEDPEAAEVAFKTESKRGKTTTLEDGRRTYSLYANVENPMVVDMGGLAMERGGYKHVDWFMNSDNDGLIIKNTAVGRYHDPQTIVIVRDSNQVKLTSNENPTYNPDIRKSRRSTDTMSNLLEMSEANYRNEQLKNSYMDAATKWRTDVSALNEYGASGFSTRMNSLIRSYNPEIGKTEADKAVAEIRNLTRKIMRNPKIDYGEIADDANKIAAKIMWGKEGITDNLKYSESAAQAVEDIRNDLLAQILSTQTKGEGKYRKLAKEFDAYKEKANENISEVRRKRDAKLDQIRQQKIDERKRRNDSKIRTHLLEVMRRLDKASKKADKATQELIQSYIKDYDLVAKSITGKKIEELMDLEDYVKNMMRIDPDFKPTDRTLANIERLHKKRISEIETTEDALALTEALLNIEYEMREHKHLIDTQYKQDIIQIGSEIYDGIMDTKGIGNTKTRFGNWFQQKYDNAIARPVIRPETETLRLVGFNRKNPLYQLMYGPENSLASGQRDMVRYQWNANRTYFDKFLNDHDFVKTIMGKKAKEYKITGRKANGERVTLSVTPDLLMALYMHGQNDQNFRHFGEWTSDKGVEHGDGITVPDYKTYKNGNVEEAYRIAANRGDKLIIKKSELNAAMNQLTKKEMAFINAAQRYYSEMSQPEINRISEKLLGYGLAQVDNYFRINTDSDYRGANMDAIKRDGTIEGMGNWKERVADARNAILLISLTEQLKRDIDAHSKYVGLAIPVRNFNKAIGVNRATVDETGKWMGSEGSVQSAIKGKWGKGAADYLEKLLSDIQNPRSNAEAWNKILGKLRSFYAGSVLALNAGVAIKQAASYPTAAAEIGWGPLIKAFGNTRLSGKLDMNLINQYSPLMYLRTQGMGYQELADLKNLSKGWLNRALNSKALNWIQDMDVMTVKKLWKAAEYYVRDNFKNLEVGSKEYYQKVGEVHSNIIERTQPNYTLLQRGEILRSDSDLVRMMLGMFKTQPFQNFSILFEATGELRAKSIAYKANPTAENKVELRSAGKKFARAVSSQLVASLVFALMQGLWDWTRGKDDKYKDKEGNLTLESAFKQIGKNMAANGFGMIPLGNVIYEVIDRIFDKNSSAYGLDASMATGIINDIQNAMFDLMSNMRNIDLDNKNTTEQHIRKYIDMAATAAQAAGYPADNFIKDAQTIAYNMFRTLGATGQMDKYEAEYYAKRVFSPVKSNNKKDYMDLLYRAYDSGDKEAYYSLYNKYINDEGFATDKHTAQENVNSNMKKHIKERTNEKDRVSVGLTQTDINRYNAALAAHDTNKSGTYQKDEIYATLMEIDLTMKQKEELWAEQGYKKDKQPQTLAQYTAELAKKKK